EKSLHAHRALLCEHRPERVACRHHADPWNQRIEHYKLHAQNIETSRLVQEMPKRRGSAELLGLDTVESIVAGDHRQPDCRDGPARQMDECRKRDHRHADCENHLGDKIVEMKVEAPAKPHDRELDQHQPDAASGEKAADVAGATSLSAVQISGNSSQEDESR